MIVDFFRAVVLGFIAPRRSARMVADSRGGLREAVLMVVLAHLISEILRILTPGIEALGRGDTIERHLLPLVQQFVVFFVLSWLAFHAGRAAGGVATLTQIQLVVAWHAVVTSFLTPLFLRFMAVLAAIEPDKGAAGLPPELQSGAVMPLAFAGAVLLFWLLAQYIAEAHRFRSALGVLGLVVAASFLATFLFFGAMGGMPAQP